MGLIWKEMEGGIGGEYDKNTLYVYVKVSKN